jgi:hypothetical protein
MHRTAAWLAAVVAAGSLLGAPRPGAAEPQYVGVQDCGRCHKKELVGDQLGAWKKTKHSKAMDALRSAQAKKIAAERGLSVPPDQADECLRCHATAHGLEKSQIYKKPLAISDGVQCESCHGPGSDYRKKTAHATSREKGVAAGMWEPEKDEKVCTACHNAESPTFDTAKGFDFEAMKKAIDHPIPKDAKGRVLELEKAARKK